MRGGTILCRGNAGHYCATGYRGEKKGMQGGKVEVFGNTGDFCAEYLAGGEVHVHGNTGDFPGVEMRGGQLIIEGDATRPCANMKDGTCVILGRVHEMIPTFEKTGRGASGMESHCRCVQRGCCEPGKRYADHKNG